MIEPGKCRSCERPVFWTLTSTGKRMPVDAEPVANGNLVLVRRTPKAAGEPDLLAIVVPDATASAPIPAANPGRYVSHFATCPDRKKWRKK